MILGISVGDTNVTIDVTDVGEENDWNIASMRGNILARLFHAAISQGVGADKLEMRFVAHRFGGDQVNVTGTPIEDVVETLVKLMHHVNEEDGAPLAAFLAYAYNATWSYLDIERVEELFQSEYKYGFDYGNYARERMDVEGVSLSYDMSDYFDYESYGEYLIDGTHTVIRFDGVDYLFEDE